MKKIHVLLKTFIFGIQIEQTYTSRKIKLLYYIKTIKYYNSDYKIEMYIKNYGYIVSSNNYSMCQWQKIKSLQAILVDLWKIFYYNNIDDPYIIWQFSEPNPCSEVIRYRHRLSKVLEGHDIKTLITFMYDSKTLYYLFSFYQSNLKISKRTRYQLFLTQQRKKTTVT